MQSRNGGSFSSRDELALLKPLGNKEQLKPCLKQTHKGKSKRKKEKKKLTVLNGDPAHRIPILCTFLTQKLGLI